MNLPFQQDARMGRLSTVLGADVLNLLTFEGREHLNGLFRYRVEALATRDDLSFDDLIGTHATVHLTSFDLPEIAFDGIVTEAEALGQGDNGWRYMVTLEPWMALLGLRRKQQIYHNKTVVQILDELFAPYSGLGQPAVEKRLAGSYPTLEYTVQYRESDLNFATRLMERFGISYHFSHTDGSHTLVLTDNATQHDDVPGGARKYQHVGAGHRANEGEHFWQMQPSQRLTTGKIRLTDYNFKTPDAAMEADHAGAAPYAEGDLEGYDYPGDYLDQSQGKGVARLRIDQHRGQDPRHRAVGDCASLRAGHIVGVTGDTVPGVGRSLCLSAQHSYSSGGYGTAEGTAPSYQGQYLLIPASAPMHPERKTPHAIVQGPQTARVVGEGEIDCDDYGRILVRFHWDLDNRHSMRCRVSQNWAGKGWGGMIIPRIGMEVIVEFLEGDPDKPIVTGCVYNGKNDTPYPLPAKKTKAVFRSDTHTGTGFNEINFEDRNGDEQIFIHAEMDMDEVIKNDLRRWVQNDTHILTENNRNEDTKKDQSTSVGQNRIDATAKTHAMTVGKDSSLKVGDKFSVVAGESVFLQGANATVIESKGDLVIKAPGGFIKISSDGITIRGTKINLNSGGSPFNGVTGEGLTPQAPDKAEVKD